MKKLLLPIMIIAILIAFYEQSLKEKNVYILVIAIAVFMFGMMKLSAKTPSKNQDKEEEDVR
jgi:membrane protein insertase Oxa1/YidC/SpoIIIJ